MTSVMKTKFGGLWRFLAFKLEFLYHIYRFSVFCSHQIHPAMDLEQVNKRNRQSCVQAFWILLQVNLNFGKINVFIPLSHVN